jgi:hypothetical protein
MERIKPNRPLVGKPTGEITRAGRPVLETPEGEMVSERSRTIPIGGKFYNVPSIYANKEYTEDELKKAIEDNRLIPTSEHDTYEEAIEAAKDRSDSLRPEPKREEQMFRMFGPQKKVIEEQFEGKETLDPESGKQFLESASDFIPGVSTAKDTTDLVRSVSEQDMLGAGVALSSLLVGAVPVVGGVARKGIKKAAEKLKLKDVENNKEKIVDEIEESKEYVDAKFLDEDKIPTKTTKGYKLFRQKDGELYPLFVDTKSPVPKGRWLEATDAYHFKDLKGVKRTPAKTGDAQPIADQATVDEMKKLGIKPTTTEKALKQSPFGTVMSVKYRPGWHGDTRPTASHLREGPDRVWAEVEFSDDVDYQSIANKGAAKLKDGSINTKTADLDYIPKGGSYRYKTNPNMEGSWLISGEMKVNKVLSENEVKALNKAKNFNEGGAVMQEQMNMAFMQEGGMQDDGGETEPKSGNKVPSGSLKEEVADDIPTMLSEGEFVFPADVVRYIGLETLMKMRQDAKQGLKMMEKMGQLGNPEEAEIPDDIPFGMADLVVISGEMKKDDDEKEEKAEGGVVGLQTGGLLDDPRFTSQVTAGTQPTEYTEEDKQEIKDALEAVPTRGEVTLKKIVNPNNPDDFEMHPFEGDEPMFPLPEGYVVDDSPTEEQIGARPRMTMTTGDDRGDSDRPSVGVTQPDPFAQPQPRFETAQDTDIMDANYGLFKEDGSPISLQETTFNNLKSEYDALKASGIKESKLSFQQYYNLPTYDKVRFALQTRLGTAPTAEQVNKALEASKEGATGLAGILSPVTSFIRNIFSSKASESIKAADPENPAVIARNKRIKAQANLDKYTNLLRTPDDPRDNAQTKRAKMAQLRKDREKVITPTEFEQYKQDISTESQAKFPSTGMVGKADDFLQGVQKDEKGNPVIFQGEYDATGKPKLNPLTAEALGRIEKNRQDVRDRIEQNVLTKDKTAVPTGPGSFMFVPSQASGDSEAQQRARDENPIEAALSQNPAYQSQEELANPFRSKGGMSKMYVGGVPTKPMKPQRLKKGGLAKPKVKPKRMKKGGLASRKK